MKVTRKDNKRFAILTMTFDDKREAQKTYDDICAITEKIIVDKNYDTFFESRYSDEREGQKVTFRTSLKRANDEYKAIFDKYS